jgi:hypothetical protein
MRKLNVPFAVCCHCLHSFLSLHLFSLEYLILQNNPQVSLQKSYKLARDVVSIAIDSVHEISMSVDVLLIKFDIMINYRHRISNMTIWKTPKMKIECRLWDRNINENFVCRNCSTCVCCWRWPKIYVLDSTSWLPLCNWQYR